MQQNEKKERERREQIQVILDKARCYAYDQFQKNHPFDLLRLSDMRSLLRLVSTGDRIVYSHYNQFMESEDAESVRDMLPSQLFYQLPLYVEGEDFVLCADAECYLREYYYMNSMIPILLRFSTSSVDQLSKGELRKFVEFFAQSITITNVLTVVHSSPLTRRRPSSSSTTRTW